MIKILGRKIEKEHLPAIALVMVFAVLVYIILFGADQIKQSKYEGALVRFESEGCIIIEETFSGRSKYSDEIVAKCGDKKLVWKR